MVLLSRLQDAAEHRNESLMGANWQYLSITSYPITQRKNWLIWDHCWTQPGQESAVASCCDKGSCWVAVFKQTYHPWDVGSNPSLNTAADPGWSTFSWVRFLISRKDVASLERRLSTKSRNADLAAQIGGTRLFSLNNKCLRGDVKVVTEETAAGKTETICA